MAVVAPDLIRLIAHVTRVFAGTEVAAEAENANLVSVLDLDEHRYLVAISGIVLQNRTRSAPHPQDCFRMGPSVIRPRQAGQPPKCAGARVTCDR